jgi:pyruvate/2-oxoglutarate dehydrogenase complex dihydrolipoamide dehydrogenase (E3) component
MSTLASADLCVIGGGSAGLSVAAGAARLGASVVLVEGGRMGGDCLNFGCVPSKSLLAAGAAAEAVRRSDRFGIGAGVPAIAGERIFGHVHGVIAAIAPHDSVERFQALGVTVLRDRARFVGSREIDANGRRIRARRFVIATGSSPAVPPISGLGEVPFLTNETIFDIAEIPSRLLVIGGGPIGLELGQAFRELGAQVTVIEQATILSSEDPELVAVIRHRLAALGIVLLERAKVTRVSASASGLAVSVLRDGAEWRVDGTHLLVAVGRRPTIADLDPEAAGVACKDDGIIVDRRLRTTNRRIYAVGDVVAGAPRFTHVAGYHADIVLRNALFRWPARVDYRAVPRVTYTHPELAQVGLTAAEAGARGSDPVVLRAGFADNDRAQTDRAADGLVKVVAYRRGRILGAGIVGVSAGELIQTWVLAISRRLRIGAVATMIAPYPTLGEASKRAAGDFYAPKLFSDRTRRLVRLLARLG